MSDHDKLFALVDKCASTRGAPAAAELFQHIAQLLSEDVERDARLDRSLRSALFRVARAGAAARSNNPRAALALLESAQGRCLFKVKVVKSGGDAGVGFLPRPREEAGALKAQLEREESAAEAGKALQRRIDECIELRLGGVGAAPFDVEAEAEEVREGFEALARLGCRCDGPDKRDMDEPEAADEVAARFLQTIDRKGTPAAARQLLRQLGLWELSTEAMLPMLRQRVPIDFSEELLEDARLLNEAPPPDEDEAARRDLTGLLSLAIDDPSTLEVDDAVSIEVLEGGKQRLWVHIADPTRYITAGSSLDVEAQRRLSSIYVPSGVVPMLPLSISAGLLSLRPGVEACALSFGIMLHADGGIEEGAVGGWGGDSDAADEKAAVVVALGTPLEYRLIARDRFGNTLSINLEDNLRATSTSFGRFNREPIGRQRAPNKAFRTKLLESIEIQVDTYPPVMYQSCSLFAGDKKPPRSGWNIGT